MNNIRRTRKTMNSNNTNQNQTRSAIGKLRSAAADEEALRKIPSNLTRRNHDAVKLRGDV